MKWFNTKRQDSHTVASLLYHNEQRDSINLSLMENGWLLCSVAALTSSPKKSKAKKAIMSWEYIIVELGKAEVRTFDTKKYATYSVTLKTNSLSFTAPYTRVHRRYNDFLWLQRRLRKIPTISTSSTVPSLPPKQFPFWNFDEEFLQKRRESLQEFLSKVAEKTLFLSSTSFHLFIQTELTVPEMEKAISRGQCDKVITKHAKSLPIDSDFVESLKASMQLACDSAPHDSAHEPRAMAEGQLTVYWRCRHNTMKKVASLPYFDALLKEYDTVINNNTNAADVDVSPE